MRVRSLNWNLNNGLHKTFTICIRANESEEKKEHKNDYALKRDTTI